MSSQPATMVDASGAVPAPLHGGLPDEISIWEILVRLPPKSLLRCRAVCRAWRHATSTRDFLLVHHAHQPTLSLLYAYEPDGGIYYQNILTFDHRAAAAALLPLVNGRSVDITPFDHQEGLAAADQLQSVARLGCGDTYMHLEASCDGLLIHYGGNSQFSICNPATHQYAPLPQLYGFNVLGMYRHSPTGEYRLLLGNWNDLAPHNQDVGSYVFTLGSGQPPRHVGCAQAEEAMYTALSVLFRGSLHWHIDQHASADNLVMVFDTTTELFWQMQAPAVPGYADLFEMGDTLGMASFNYAKTIVDLWVMQDYENQVWAFKCRIELPVEAHISMQCESYRNLGNVVVMPGDGELLVLVESDDWLHHVDINGKLVASFHRSGLGHTQLRLKQTLVPHTFFPTLDGYVVRFAFRLTAVEVVLLNGPIVGIRV